jgi:hypothetical protein
MATVGSGELKVGLCVALEPETHRSQQWDTIERTSEKYRC